MYSFSDDTIPSFLKRENLRLVIFGGKGGAGKTTLSAATAMYLAQLHPDKRILVASSDPAHSLGDSFDCPVDSSTTPVKGMDNLWAIEMDSTVLLEKFKDKHRSAIERLYGMSFYSDQIDIRDFLSFKLPGMEVMMILLEISNLLRFGIFRPYEYDLVILDTAPTGHTLRLLALPDKMLKWLELFNISFARYKLVSKGVAALGFNIIPGQTFRPKRNVQEFLDRLSKDLTRIRTVLKNPEECEFVPVTIPEELSIAETERLLSVLKEEGIRVRNIVVNRLQDENQCVFCSNRRRGQESYLAEIDEKFAPYNLIKLPVLPHEVRGREALLKFAGILTGENCRYSPVQPIDLSTETGSFVPGMVSEILNKDLQFIIFGGKGGVGKTTISAATALSVAKQNPDKKVLVFSTDPAHSLSDSFACPIGGVVTPIIEGEGNLHALEMDSARLYEDFSKEYKANIEDAFKKWQRSSPVGGRKWKLDFDQKVMVEFVDVYPPGLEEVLALERIMGFVDRKEYDIYIFDTAPTGHLIELLKFPELVREWLRITYRAILKYQMKLPVDNLEIIGKRILDSHATIRKMREVLTDPRKSEFVAVTIPEAMGLLETEDLLSSIRWLGIPCSHIIVNMVIPPTECGFCASKRKEQIGYIQEVGEKDEYAGYVVTKIPLFPHEIRGMDNLVELSRFMYEKETMPSKLLA